MCLADGMEVDQDLSTTESDTDTVATPSAPEGVNAELILLRSKYFNFFICGVLTFSLFSRTGCCDEA